MLDKSQINAVERHLKEKGSITSKEAIELYGATRLSAIIFKLRKRYEGSEYDIETQRAKGVNRYGNSMSFGKYILVNKEVAR